jgi:hypothetical protein
MKKNVFRLNSSFVIFLALILCINVTVNAQQQVQPNTNVITEITIQGLTRTKKSVVVALLKKYNGIEAASLDLNDVRAAILDSGILEAEKVEIIPSGSGNILAVTVREKWSIIPAPVVSFGSNGSMLLGLAFADMNALGLNDKLFVAGSYTASDSSNLEDSGGGMINVSFTHNPQNHLMPSWTIGANYMHRDNKITGADNEQVRRYTTDEISALLRLSYPRETPLSVNMGIAFYHRILNQTERDLKPPEHGFTGIGLMPSLMFKHTTYDGYLSAKQNLSLEYSALIGNHAQFLHQINFSGDFEQPIVPGFKMNFRGAVLYSPFTTLIYPARPSRIAPIFPSGFLAFHYAGAAAGLEKYIYRWKYGTLAVLANYQGIWTSGPDFENSFDHGFSAWLCFYLARIAIPAVSFGVSYNVHADYFSTYMTIGMSF